MAELDRGREERNVQEANSRGVTVVRLERPGLLRLEALTP